MDTPEQIAERLWNKWAADHWEGAMELDIAAAIRQARVDGARAALAWAAKDVVQFAGSEFYDIGDADKAQELLDELCARLQAADFDIVLDDVHPAAIVAAAEKE